MSDCDPTIQRSEGMPGEQVILPLNIQSVERFLRALASAYKDECNTDALVQSLQKLRATLEKENPRHGQHQGTIKLLDQFLCLLE